MFRSSSPGFPMFRSSSPELVSCEIRLGRVKALHGCFRGYISDVIYLAIRVFVSHKGIYLD